MLLSHVDLAHLLQQPLAGGGLFLLAHNAGLFVVLAFFHFRKNAGLFHLLFKAAQGDIEVIFVFGKKYSGHRNHHLFCNIRLSKGKCEAATNMSSQLQDSEAAANRAGRQAKHVPKPAYTIVLPAAHIRNSTERQTGTA